ncbi:asparagine synthase (glutamine-hydrolyzing) [Curvibacter lanceolatus]|uniref:asparagine synthase (glutamine-hydrolyzing) n=1 Tax=Curvibacter lanceolatus TaxID=86182 RepID=UPI00039F1FD3|nr:asparagine synthase (glutamine-hydrolyzing) [Curvibacter lanceolatus]
MCAILGWVGVNLNTSSLNIFSKALDSMKHRGPDGDGFYSDGSVNIAHARLSIIDLSDDGKQPMRDDRTGCVLVFNGEIYNYIELRNDLIKLGHQFKSQSDTEVLLKAWGEWGELCLGKLNGMFAFSIYDPKVKKIFCVRDRFGVKPLYYFLKNQEFGFASEPKALLQLNKALEIVNDQVLFQFLALGRLHASSNSFYENVKVLQPGQQLIYDIEKNSISIKSYWTYPTNLLDLNANEAYEKFEELFDDAVKIRMRSDVPVGLSLSGGLDSSAILCSIAKLSNFSDYSNHLFTSVYGESSGDESAWARCASDRFNLALHEVTALKKDWIPSLSRIVQCMDGPGYSPAVFPLWQLLKYSRSTGVKVVLDGQGADEIFGGYAQYSADFLIDLIFKLGTTPKNYSQFFEYLREASATHGTKNISLFMLRESMPFLLSIYRKKNGISGILNKDFLSKVTPRDVDFPAVPPNYDRTSRRMFFDHSVAILPGLLQYGDAVGMGNGVECRNPFMDFRLVNFAFQLGTNIKMFGGKTKWLIRQYLRKNGLPLIAERRDKKGYPTPIYEWMLENDAEILRDYLLSSNSKMQDYCSAIGIVKLINNHKRGNFSAGNALYRLISTEFWLRSIGSDFQGGI